MALLHSRLDDVVHAAAEAAASKKPSAKVCHQVRVASRRAGAALAAMGQSLDAKCTRRLQKILRQIREAAAPARDADVCIPELRELVKRAQTAARSHAALTPEADVEPLAQHDQRRVDKRRGVGKMGSAKPSKAAKALAELIELARTDRSTATAELADAVRVLGRKRFTRTRKKLHGRGGIGAGVNTDGGEAAARVVPAAVARTRRAAENLESPESLHNLRLRCKRLRYVLEFFEPELPPAIRDAHLPALREVISRLGAVSDGAAVLARLRAGRKLIRRGKALKPVIAHFKAELRTRANAARGVWAAFEKTGALNAIEAAFTTGGRLPGAAALVERVENPASGAAGRAGSSPGDERGDSGPKAVASASSSHAAGASGSDRLVVAVPSAMGPPSVRVAAIDIGTNSIRLIIAEAAPDGTYRVLDDEKDLARLGVGLEKTGALDPRAMEQAALAIARMESIARGYGARVIRAVATHAVRDASNGGEFTRLVRDWSGIDIEIISGQEEARLAFESVAAAFDLSSIRAAVVDVGGGSSEIALCSSGVVEAVYTLPLGAVRLTERYGGADAVASRRFGKLQRDLERTLDRAIADLPFKPDLVIATGGTANALGNFALHREREALDAAGRAHDAPPPGAVQGYELKRPDLRRLMEALRELRNADRKAIPAISTERADIIVAGASVLRAIVRRLGAKRVRIHDGGIRDGLILGMIRKLFPGVSSASLARPGDPLRAVRRFAEACRADVRHTEQVAGLALSIFDQLAQIPSTAGKWASPMARRLLHAGALLLDVGYVIGYEKHHVHSANLIQQSALPGFSKRDLAVIAALARYHRGASPSADHEHFDALSPDDRDTVTRLAAIIRVAVGLDRTHTQAIRDVRLLPEGKSLRLFCESDADPTVDLWGASRKAGLFEEVFGVTLQPMWKPRKRALGGAPHASAMAASNLPSAASGAEGVDQFAATIASAVNGRAEGRAENGHAEIRNAANGHAVKGRTGTPDSHTNGVHAGLNGAAAVTGLAADRPAPASSSRKSVAGPLPALLESPAGRSSSRIRRGS